MTRFPFLWPLAGLMAGIGFGYLAPPPTAAVIAPLLIALVLVRWYPLAAAAILGGFLGLAAALLSPAPSLPPELALRGIVETAVTVRELRAGPRLGVEADWNGSPVPLLVPVPDGYRPRPGDVLHATVAIGPAAGADYEGGFSRARYLARQGYAAPARLERWSLVAAGDEPFRAWVWRLRDAVRFRLRETLGESGGWAVGIFLGDKGDLTAEELERFRLAGLSHLLAVSGLNVGIVAMLAAGLFGWLPRSLKPVPILAAVLLHAFLVGDQPPVLRATVMFVVLLIAPLVSRPPIPIHAVSLAAFGLLLWHPADLFDPGFQMSFVLVFFLVWAARSFPALMTKWWGAIAITGLAQLAVYPLTLRYFHFVAPASLLINLVLLPTFTWVLVWILVALLSPFPAVTALTAKLFAAHVAGMEALAGLGEAGPWRHVNLPPPSPVWGGLYYAALLGLLAPGLARRTRVLLALALAGLAFAPALATLPPQVEVLAIGQGDSALLRDDAGAVLVDAGPARGAPRLIAQLRSRGINRLDLVVISHPHEDHCGGLAAVLAELPVGEVAHGGWADGDTAALELPARFREYGVPERELTAGEQLTLMVGTNELRLARMPGSTANNRSVVVHAAWHGGTFLFTGDLEAEGTTLLLASGQPLRADVLKIPHHGARNPELEKLFAAVRPRAAVVTAELRNRFGFPHPDTVRRLAESGIAWSQTGRAGRVTFLPPSAIPEPVPLPPYPW